MSYGIKLWNMMRQSQPCRFVALFGIAVSVTVWGAILSRVDFERRTEIAATMRSNQSLTIAFAYHIRNQLDTIDDQINFIKKEYETYRTVTPAIQDRIRGTRLFMVNQYGAPLASALETGIPGNLSDREYFRVHQASDTGKLHLAKPRTSLLDGRTIFQATRRINLPDGSFGGVVGAGLKPEWFSEFFQDLELGASHGVAIIGDDGIVRMYQTQGNINIGIDISNTPIFKRMMEHPVGGSFVETATTDNITRIFSYHRMKDYPLLVQVFMTEAEALAAFQQRKIRYYGAGGVAIALILLFCGYLMSLIWRQQESMTARHEMEERFVRSFDYAPIGMALISLDGRFLRVNKAICNLFGYSEDELLEKTLRDISHPDNGMDNSKLQQELLAGTISDFQEEKKYCSKAGQPISCRQTIAVVRDSSGNPLYFISQIEDVTLRKQAEEELRRANEMLEQKVNERTMELQALNSSMVAANEELERLTLVDGLTGIANRRYFNEYLEREWRTALRQGKPLGLIMVDIDYFKRYNDTYGHQSGDACLKMVAVILDGSVRRAADLTARYGGEEFAIILPDTDLKGTAAKADQLRRQVEKVGLEHRSAPLGQVTVSMGVASLLATPDFNPEDLVGLADQALYRAKQEGRNRIMESPGS